MKIQRERAKYSWGPIKFTNPGPGPLQSVSYCTLDNMIHVFLRHSPIEGDDDYLEIGRSISLSCKNVTGVRKGGGQKKSLSDGIKGYVDIWWPGKIDLEDVVRIIEGVPELEASWLRKELNKLKQQAGLDDDDLPFFDNDPNDRNEGALYMGSLISRNGGMAAFYPEIPETTLEEIGGNLEAHGAITENTERIGDKISISFKWIAPRQDTEETRDCLRKILASIPGVLKPAPEKPAEELLLAPA